MPTKKLQMLGYKIVPPEHIGLSAFEIAVENGFEGDEAEWLEYLATLKIHTISDLDLATAPGLYQVAEGSPSTLPSQYADFIHGTVFVEKNDDRIFQTISHKNISAKRFNNLDEHTWSEWEFVNPPYLTDIEYRTTDRINDKAVYKKITPDGILRYRLDGESIWHTYTEHVTQESLGITQESIGAAPAGYGYGGESVTLSSTQINNDDELEAALETIYSGMTNRETKLVRFYGFPSGSDFVFFGFLFRSSNNYGSFIAHSAYLKGSLITKTKYNGTWEPLEWSNPPLKVGVEYRTTDRINDKAVYKKITPDGILRYRLDGENTWYTYQESLGITKESLGITKESIGAAPAGYGIGRLENYSCASDADIDRILIEQIGVMGAEQTFKRFALSFTTTNNVTGAGGHYYTDIYKLSTNYAMITIKSYIEGGRTLQRVWYAGNGETQATLKPWEWVNPPLKVGVEYRTTERWNGEVVYRKLMSYKISALNPAGTYTDIDIPHDIANIKDVVSCVGKKGAGLLLPYLAATSGGASVNIVDGTNIVLRIVNDEYSMGTWYFDLTYTKSM